METDRFTGADKVALSVDQHHGRGFELSQQGESSYSFAKGLVPNICVRVRDLNLPWYRALGEYEEI